MQALTETVLISLATGARPFTSEIALKALTLAVRELKTSGLFTHVTVHLGVWDGKTPSYLPVADELRVFELRHGVKPEILNHSLRLYGEEHPRWWFTMDDDVVLAAQTLPEMVKLAQQVPAIGLWGAWNDESEQDRGTVVRVGSHLVQNDRGGAPFCVGGALHLVPRETLIKVGSYPDLRPRHEDAEYCNRVRAAGLSAVLVRTLGVAVLPSDGVTEGYRDHILRMHYQNYDPRSRRAESADRLRGADEGPPRPDDGSS